MLAFVTAIHLFVAVLLILLVLIQDSKGGAMGGMLGGGTSNSLFGATGAATLIVKVTRWVAIVFAGTCMLLAVLITKSNRSVLEGVAVPVGAPVATPAPGPESIPPATAPGDEKKPANP